MADFELAAPGWPSWTFEDADIEFIGYQGTGWVDFDLHDDSRPKDAPSVVARVMLSPDRAREVARQLLAYAELADSDRER